MVLLIWEGFTRDWNVHLKYCHEVSQAILPNFEYSAAHTTDVHRQSTIEMHANSTKIIGSTLAPPTAQESPIQLDQQGEYEAKPCRKRSQNLFNLAELRRYSKYYNIYALLSFGMWSSMACIRIIRNIWNGVVICA